MFLTAVVGMQQMRAGTLTPLAIAAPARFEMLPDVATMAEVGFELEAAYWFGLAAPAGTPPAILAKLEKALAEILAMPDLHQRLTEMGAVVTPLGSKEFGGYIQSEVRKWSDVSPRTSSRSNNRVVPRPFTVWTLTVGIPLGVKWPDSRAARRLRRATARACGQAGVARRPCMRRLGQAGNAGRDPDDRGGLGGSSAA